MALRPNGVLQQQVFFSWQRETTAGEAAYNQKVHESIFLVERSLENEIVWKVHNKLTRLSSLGKAVTMQVPLLAEESVLSPNTIIENNRLAVQIMSRFLDTCSGEIR